MPHLSPPVTDQDHAQGPPDAPVTLVEYGDYQCPTCGDAYPIVKAVQEAMGDRLRFVHRNFPLSDIHRHAEHAAEAAETAGALGEFWPMHDHLYENQQALTDDDLMVYADALDLDIEAFRDQMTRHAHADRVQQDFEGGVRSGVHATPTFFINGASYDGDWDEESLLAALEQAAA